MTIIQFYTKHRVRQRLHDSAFDFDHILPGHGLNRPPLPLPKVPRELRALADRLRLDWSLATPRVLGETEHEPTGDGGFSASVYQRDACFHRRPSHIDYLLSR